MKRIILSLGIVILLTTMGCEMVGDHGSRGGVGQEYHEDYDGDHAGHPDPWDRDRDRY